MKGLRVLFSIVKNWRSISTSSKTHASHATWSTNYTLMGTLRLKPPRAFWKNAMLFRKHVILRNRLTLRVKTGSWNSSIPLCHPKTRHFAKGKWLVECHTALSQMESCKSPGMDGLPAEFYCHFWGLLEHDLSKNRVFIAQERWSFVAQKLLAHLTFEPWL